MHWLLLFDTNSNKLPMWLLCWFALLVVLSTADESVNGFKKMYHFDMFQNSTKHWLSYIRSFLSKSLYHIPCVSFVLHLRKYIMLSKIFHKSHKLIQEYHAKDISVKFYGFTDIKLVAASGRICINGSHFEDSYTTVDTNCQKLLRVPVLWRFNLDPKLRLNITFQSLHFITNWNNPQKGNVKLCGVKCTANKTLFSDHGIHPSFPVYPDLQDLAIQLEFISQARTNFSIKVLYSIMDRKVLAMYPKERKQHWSTAALFFHQNVVALTYHVQVEKSTLLLLQNLNITEILGIVHDGPGFLSPVLELKSSSLKLSSFQCILQLLASSMSRTESFVSIRSIVSKATIIKAITQTESFLFSSSSCQNNPCVLHLKSSSNTQTKVTIKHFQYYSEEIMNCNFGAMVISDKLTHSYCQLYNTNLDPPDFYSKNPNFTIVIYWYKFYTFIKIILLAIEAKCKAVQLDFCTHTLCEKQSVLCYQYLSDALSGSNMSLQFFYGPHLHYSKYRPVGLPGFAVHSILDLMNFRLKQHSCSVLQLRQTGNAIFHHLLCSCKMCISSASYKVERIKYLFNKAYIKRIKFHGRADSVCVPKQKGNLLHCRQNHQLRRIYNNFSFFEYNNEPFIRNTNTLLVEAVSPMDRKKLENYFEDIFAFSTEVELPIEEWIDIKLQHVGNLHQVYPHNMTEIISSDIERYHLKLMQQFHTFILLMRPNFPKKKLVLKCLYDNSLFQKHTVQYVFKPLKEMQKCTLFIIVRMQIKFSQVKPDKYFQYLAGPSPDNSFELSRINYNRQQTFNVLQMRWLKTPATKTLNHEECVADLSKFDFCHVFSLANQVSKHTNTRYLLFEIFPIKDHYFIKQTEPKCFVSHRKSTGKMYSDLRSWVEASQLCTERSSFLPVLTDENTLQEFINILKQIAGFSVSPAIYIGLTLQSKVQNSISCIKLLFVFQFYSLSIVLNDFGTTSVQ